MQAALSQLLDQGFCVFEGVLSQPETLRANERLRQAAITSEHRGSPTHIPGLDPNDRNVRVFNLLDLDPLFLELIQHPMALEIVHATVGQQFLISNFTANIARPGARSMVPHSDLSIVFPGPWLAPWSVNVIWCLDDLYAANGATRYVPGSHKFEYVEDVPTNLMELMQPFEAKAGSVIAMDGRLWHTSGENRTQNQDRALLFGYYSASFLRPQVNWNVLLSESTKAGLSPQMQTWLGLGPAANVARPEFAARPRD